MICPVAGSVPVTHLAKDAVMNIRLRKFIGTVILVIFSMFYFVVAITVAIVRLPDTSTLTQLAFYFVATAIWFVVAAALIYWMQRNPAGQGKS